MKVLFLHQTFPSANEDGSGRAYDFAKYLVHQGDEVTIIAGRFSYLSGNALTNTSRGFIVREAHPEGFLVLRPWSYMGYHKSYFGRMLTYITYMITSFVTALSAGKFDLVVGATPPISVGIIGALVAFFKRTPYVFEVRDLWSEVAIQLGFIKNRVLIAVVRKVERAIYRFADRIVINSPGFTSHLEAIGIPGEKIKLVPNGVDLDIFRPDMDGNEVRVRYGVQDRVVAVYAGSLGMANDIDTILNAAEVTRDENISFILVGDGKERRNLEQKCQERKIKNVIFTGPQKKQDIPSFLAAADAGVVTLLDIPLFKTVYPNKVFDTMACGKPVVLLVDGVARQLVEEAQAGLFVPPANPVKLAKAMIYLRDNPIEAHAMGRRGRAFLEGRYDREKCAQLMHQVLIGI
jgi:glycosyltransferase involved in cell wall biosynthesis